jgi:membrane protease YdiL (CAAX protease family)
MSVGAGLWEELVFRLGVMGSLVFLLTRREFLSPRSALGVALLVSALTFALYHHVGSAGEPFALDRFAFRAAAGTILGLLFALRGLAVVVYMHVFYDLLCDLRTLL